jgi:hypothetical protein
MIRSDLRKTACAVADGQLPQARVGRAQLVGDAARYAYLSAPAYRPGRVSQRRTVASSQVTGPQSRASA